MKDSFLSFAAVDAEMWIVNIRGSLKYQALSFLRIHLKDKLFVTTFESGNGWFHDSQILLPNICTDYVLYWVEDHINMAEPAIYQDIFDDMYANRVDYLFTSWWRYDKAVDHYRHLSPVVTPYLNIHTIDRDSLDLIKQVRMDYYLISLCGAFSLRLFARLLSTRQPILRRYPKETPFDLEKRSSDLSWLPLVSATPNLELFAPIDDDLGGIHEVCLQSRGLYPKRVTREPLASPAFAIRAQRSRFFIYPILTIVSRTRVLLRRISYHF